MSLGNQSTHLRYVLDTWTKIVNHTEYMDAFLVSDREFHPAVSDPTPLVVSSRKPLLFKLEILEQIHSPTPSFKTALLPTFSRATTACREEDDPIQYLKEHPLAEHACLERQRVT